MPLSATKKAVSLETIDRMVQRAFGTSAGEICELTEGYFNVAYSVSVRGEPVLLKVAPPAEMEVMTYEQGIMFSEVDAMRMVAERTDVPLPRVLYFDGSFTLLDRPHFFMEYLKGRSFSECIGQMSEEEKDRIFFDMGRYTKRLNQIPGKAFGYYGQPEKQGMDWYAVFRNMLLDVYADGKRKQIPLPVEREMILTELEKDRGCFAAVVTPCFVHWDIWEGNVFIHQGEIEGIIDFERCLWADPLMEVGFRTYRQEKAFLAGYGKGRLEKEEACRARWYDVYLFLLACQECDYRQYENREVYEWGSDMLHRWIAERQSHNIR